VSIVGAPLQHGQHLAGVDLGPTIIRKSGLVDKLKQDDWLIDDQGDVPMANIAQREVKANHRHPIEDIYSKVNFSREVGSANAALATATYNAAHLGNFVLTLGGDHAIAIGSIAGILKARPNAGIIWVDAHADINTHQTSHSGNLHGMVLSFLMSLHNVRDIPGFHWMKDIPVLRENRLVYIGLRDVDRAEKIIIREYGIKTFTMQDIDRWGIGMVMEMALDYLCHRSMSPRDLHLSFDIDAIDPAYAPSTGTRVLGGLSYREAYYIAEAAAETGLLTSMDMVEVNPTLGENSPDNPQSDGHVTAGMAVGLIASALGNTIL